MNFKPVAVFYVNRKLLINLMKAFILLFCTTVFSFSGNKLFSQNASINIEMDTTVTVDEVFKMIKSQTNYTFIYQEDLFKDAPLVDLKKGVISANELLLLSLENQKYEFLYDEATETLLVRSKKNNSSYLQQTYMVKGTITDTSGNPIPGATVIYKEYPERGKAADFSGNYQILVNENEVVTLQFSSIGYMTKEIAVQGRTRLDVMLQEETTALDEIVVVGYISQKRSEVSSAVSSVKSEKVINNLGTNTSFDRGLNGLVKGVQVIQGSGQPGTGVDINIRGITSPFAGSNNNPLFVIDGVPFQVNPAFAFNDDTSFNQAPNPLQSINPSDIESIDILKDASATAIYGSRGANGVIIVNTKKGRKGEKTNITFTTTTTLAEPINTPKYLNTAQYKARAAHILENSAAFANVNSALSIYSVNSFDYIADLPIDFNTFTIAYNGLRESWFGDADTSWVNEVYRDPAFTQQYNLNINGGSEKTSYGLTLGHTDQQGLLASEKFKQYNFRSNLDTRISKAISAGFNANLGYSNYQTGYDSNNSSLNSTELSGRPDIAPRDEFGNFNRLPGKLYGFYDSLSANPLAMVTGHDYNTKSFSLLGNVYMEIKPFKGLKIRSDINVGRFTSDVNNYTPASIVGDITPDFGYNGTSADSYLNMTTTANTNLIANLTATYSKVWSQKHNLSTLFGVAWDRNYSNRTYFFYQGFPDDNTLTNSTAALQVLSKAASEIETGLNSIFSQVSYNYDQRYFLTLNFRTDRSVKFGPENQRGYFPSAAASWNIAQEDFLKDSKFVNNLRLRSGYGRSGSNNIEDFAYLQFWNIGFRADGLYNGNSAVGLNGDLPNESIKWETTDEFNLGVDFELFNNRLRGSLDYYKRITTGALMAGTYLLESGAGSYTQNFANLTNKGFEIDVFGDVIRNTNLTWSLGFNIAKNKNTLDEFNENGISSYLSRYYELGKEVNIIRGYVTEGFFQTQSEIDVLNASAPDGIYQEVGTAPGDYRYVDLDGDGKITSADQKYLGSAQPDFFGGFNSVINYKRFDLSANFSFSTGGETIISADSYAIAGDPTRNVETRYLDTWTPDNMNAKYPRAIINDRGLNNNIRTSSALVHDVSYLRLQSLQLRYNLAKELIQSFGLSRASVFLTGTNLWTITNFDGIDPASIGGLAGIGSTFTRDPYPIAKTWSLGFNVNF